MRGFAVAAVLLPLLAGCIAPGATTARHSAAPFDLVVPPLDAALLLAEVEAFSEAFPMRRGDNEAHQGARAHVVETLRGLGYEVHEDEFEAPVDPRSTPTNVAGSRRLVNVCAFHWGTTHATEWIFVGAHHDVTDGAVHGAYDDASGVMFVLHLAAAFADLPTPRTIVFCTFDGEEQGLKGSGHIVEALAKGEWVLDNGTAVGMIDFDMAGITWPASPPLVADVVSPEMKDVVAATAARLGFPDGAVEYRAIRGGNSDNGPFKAAEVPSVLLISDFDEVAYRGVTAPERVTYPFWHRYDTYDGMVALAEGEENLRAGFQNVADIGSALLAFMASGATLTFDPSAAGQ